MSKFSELLQKIIDKVNSTVKTVNGQSPDENGNVQVEVSGGSGGSGSPAIIDVVELPTENIREDCFYRLLTGKFTSNYYNSIEDWTCHVVDGLPESGDPVSTDMVHITAYYNTKDNGVYGYADVNISAAASIPVGWYPIDALAQAFEIDWGGVTTDPSDIYVDSVKLLLQRDLYLYEAGWTKTVFAREKTPEFSIEWNGNMDGKFALDMSMLGYDEGIYFVKVSDEVFTTDQLRGARYKIYNSTGKYYEYSNYIGDSEYDLDTETYPGAIAAATEIIVVYDADTLNAALGLPAGTIPTGTFFYNGVDYGYVSELIGPKRIAKLDYKYLPDDLVDAFDNCVQWSDLTSNFVQKYELTNNYATKTEIANTYAKTSEVQSLIDSAITGAIGGDY